MCNWSYEWYRPVGPCKISEISDHFANFVNFALQGILARRSR